MKTPRYRSRTCLRAGLVLASPVALLLLWWAAAGLGWVRPIILPSPDAVLASFLDMLRHGYSGVPLWTHLAASAGRVGVAFATGAVLGVALGLLRARSGVADALLLVPAEVLRPIPPLGLVPLFILWFGIGELSKVLLILVSVLLIMMVSAQAGAASASLDAIRAARSLGAGRLQVFRHVILPSALPQIMTGLRVAMGAALSILVASELLGGDKGLGFIVLDAANFFRTPYVFAGVLLIGAFGMAADRLFAWLGRRIVHWQRQADT